MKSPTNHVSAARRVAAKRHREAAQQAISKLDPEFVAKLRHDCLRAAHARMAGAEPHAVVRSAQVDFEARVRFLTGAQS
jgi:hypothetical protein